MNLALIGTIVFFFLAPVTVAGLVPWWISHWRMQPPLLGFAPVRFIGLALILAGVPVVVDSFARFALQGRGTPAPVAPTETLVVTGLYRYVRNPMYVAVLATITGQALFFGNIDLLIYAACVFAAFHLFVITYEEPTLRGRYAGQYAEFTANVPRWIPRLRPFQSARSH